jgi:tRNA 2-thiouridine synthesizing protein C
VKFLYLLRRPPYLGSMAAETIDSILVAGVFDQQVSVLFKDDGVLQLLKDQQGQLLGHRSVNRMLTALPEYDIDDLFVCARSLELRKLRLDQLAFPVQILDDAGQQALIAAAHVVMND